MARLLTYTINASIVAGTNNTNGTPNTTLMSDGQDWSNFSNSTDTSDGNDQLFSLAPGTTTSVVLPTGATTAQFVAWKFDQKVSLVFSYGTTTNTQFGIQQGSFTSLQITVSSGYTTNVNGHIVILGA